LEEFQHRIEKLEITTEAAIDALNNIQLTELKIGTDVVKKLPSRLPHHRASRIFMLSLSRFKPFILGNE